MPLQDHRRRLQPVGTARQRLQVSTLRPGQMTRVDLAARADLDTQVDPASTVRAGLVVPASTVRAGLAVPGGPWHGDAQRGYFNRAPWGEGPAPWGYGEPPRPAWDRPLPPPGGYWNNGPINYWGYEETPVWNPGFNQWGFDFFGVWIPL